MTLPIDALVNEGLLDPEQTAFFANGSTFTPVNDSTDEAHKRHLEEAAVGLAAAFIVLRNIMSKELQRQHVSMDSDIPSVVAQAWKRVTPLWLKLAIPALKQAYSLGVTKQLTDEQLTLLATDYANNLGVYINSTSADALAQGFMDQLREKWSEPIAWMRASAAYGLDKHQMKTYVKQVMMLQGNKQELIPMVARAAVDKAMVMRAEKLGDNEIFHASKLGQSVVWLVQQKTGQLPPDAEKEWITADDERVCSICGPLHHKRVKLDQQWHTIDGEKIWAPGIHPRCRCNVRLIYPEIKNDTWSVVEKNFNPNQPRDKVGRFALIAGAATVAIGVPGVRRFVVAGKKARVAQTAFKGIPKTADPHSAILLRMSPNEVKDHLRKVSSGDKDATTLHSNVFSEQYTNNFQYRVRNHPDEDDVKTYHHLLRHADPTITPELHRGMHGVEHEIGDEIDFGPISSWSEKISTAEDYSFSRESTIAPRKYGGTYTLPAGRIGSVPVGDRESFAEHLTGGRFRVAAKHTDTTSEGHQLFRYHLEPINELGKRLGDDQYDRDPRGRFASREQRRGFRPAVEQTRDPEVDRIMEQAREVVEETKEQILSPFAEVESPFTGTTQSPFANTTSPFAQASPFTETQTPFGVVSPFTPQRRKRRTVLIFAPGETEPIETEIEAEEDEVEEGPYWTFWNSVREADPKDTGDPWSVIRDTGGRNDDLRVGQIINFDFHNVGQPDPAVVANQLNDPPHKLAEIAAEHYNDINRWTNDPSADALTEDYNEAYFIFHEAATANMERIISRLKDSEIREIFRDGSIRDQQLADTADPSELKEILDINKDSQSPIVDSALRYVEKVLPERFDLQEAIDYGVINYAEHTAPSGLLLDATRALEESWVPVPHVPTILVFDKIMGDLYRSYQGINSRVVRGQYRVKSIEETTGNFHYIGDVIERPKNLGGWKIVHLEPVDPEEEILPDATQEHSFNWDWLSGGE